MCRMGKPKAKRFNRLEIQYFQPSLVLAYFYFLRCST